MIRLVKKMATSASVMGMVASLLQPLRMLILAPLMLTSLSAFELDVYFLLVGASVITTLVRSRLCDIFSTMLSFSYAGADDLSPRKNVSLKAGDVDPNWKGFGSALGTLRLLEQRVVFPLFLFSLLIAFVGVVRVRSIYEWDFNTWFAVLAGTTAVHIMLFQTHIEAGLKGSGKITTCYQINILTSVIFVILAVVLVLSGLGITGLVICQFFTSILTLYLFKKYLKLPDVALSAFTAARYKPDIQVIEWAWKPLWKSALMSLSTMGIYRASGMFVAGIGSVGTVASFMFAQNILLVISSVSISPVVSQFPALSASIAKGKFPEFAEYIFVRVGLSSWIYLFSIIAAGCSLPWLLNYIGSNAPFPDASIWFLYGILFFFVQWLQMWASICDRTNEMLFYRRYLIAACLSLVGLYFATLLNNLYGIVLSITIPQVIMLNYSPLVKISLLSNMRISKIIIKSFSVCGVLNIIKSFKN